MAKHGKNRKYQWGYPPQYMPPMLAMPMGGSMFPFPPPPPLMTPSFMPFPQPHTATPLIPEAAPQHSAENTFELHLERACLPHFKSEYESNVVRSPTDIVIMDFDRSLLITPALNMDLIDKDSRYVLESRLGPHSGWWQSPIVLGAAIELGNWDANLLEIARSASLNPKALLIITTYRHGELEPRIRAALAEQGVPSIDHFACSSGSHYTMGSKAKHQLLDVVLEAYSTIERVFVYDASSPDRKAYDQAAYRHVKIGSFVAETFRVPSIYVPRVLFEPRQERRLIEKLVEASAVPITASIATINWRHILKQDSRDLLLKYVAGVPPFADATQLLCSEIAILSGNLPPELRPHVGEPGKQYRWKLAGYEVHGRTIFLYAVPLGQPPLAEPYTANGARFDGARLAKQIDTPFTPLDGPEFTTAVYEGRALRLHETKR